MKPGGGASPRARQSGGFNAAPGGAGLGGEHLDESAFQQMMQSKQAGLQGSQAGSALQGQTSAGTQKRGAQRAPRLVAPLKEPSYFVQDLAKSLGSFVDINKILGVEDTDTPDQQARKKQFHQRYQRLSQDEQAYVQKKYQQDMKEKQQQEEEKERKKQAEQEEKNQRQIESPTKPKKGPVGLTGNRKQKAKTIVQRQRQKLGSVQGANWEKVLG